MLWRRDFKSVSFLIRDGKLIRKNVFSGHLTGAPRSARMLPREL
jgi:hypothetical protein